MTEMLRQWLDKETNNSDYIILDSHHDADQNIVYVLIDCNREFYWTKFSETESLKFSKIPPQSYPNLKKARDQIHPRTMDLLERYMYKDTMKWLAMRNGE
jgi:hypothetical protein